LSPLCPDQLWGPTCLLSNGYQGFFRGCKARPGSDADPSPHLVPRSGMGRSCRPPPPWLLRGGIGKMYFFTYEDCVVITFWTCTWYRKAVMVP
jgi:hypothetical protein